MKRSAFNCSSWQPKRQNSNNLRELAKKPEEDEEENLYVWLYKLTTINDVAVASWGSFFTSISFYDTRWKNCCCRLTQIATLLSHTSCSSLSHIEFILCFENSFSECLLLSSSAFKAIAKRIQWPILIHRRRARTVTPSVVVNNKRTTKRDMFPVVICTQPYLNL